MSKKNKLFSWLGFGKDDNAADNAVQQPESSDVTDATLPVQHSAETDTAAPTDTQADPVTQTDATTQIDSAPPAAIAPVEPAAIVNANAAKKPGFFSRLKQGLAKTSQNLGSGLAGLFSGRKIDDELYEELETQLLLADVGVDTTQKLIRQLEQHADRKSLKDSGLLFEKLQQDMATLLKDVEQPLQPVSANGPFVILMVGVNGVGKTTTIGKMAQQFKQQGKSVMLAAGDTFRAAAVEQLQVWGERNHIPVIAQHTGADSASVIFDAYQAAKARKADVLIADTAGRLQNKAHLMEELKKIVRVLQKIDPTAPHEVMLTLDAGTGQNALSQAKVFNEAVQLTGISLTKLDGTAKGGVIFAIADQFKVPLRYIGVGEGIDDLRVFNSQDFIRALFNRES
ncbi:signal recognition particle-docking protein FtsY [Rheinheimera sp. YQF-2]|uniref:Signal recognition particle receptor FtsY n=1 Tax=Rheinheimera lutimaris TaxID=2740584 RepID=A0A7Y5AMI5_9GAMM|nr:signal recognition particle-docking protein FtsY [Rheinheimera lutimaris]NRQ41140.1 signal recognition particle-docking protein FtsY [Rheinheimera lutimaris]